METALAHWLLDNKPYTHLHVRVKHFIVLCRQLEPALSHRRLRKEVMTVVDRLLSGEVGRLWLRDRSFERVIRLYGQDDQRTAQWHAKRGEMVTASEVYKVFTTEESYRELLLRKVAPPPPTGIVAAPLIWGTRMEPVAKRIYEQSTDCSIIDVSCVVHPRHPFLGASPDGLIVPNTNDPLRYGRLVEFKCPISRAPKDEIPVAYWHQMQMQMECTGVDECEYVEFRFSQVNYSEWAKSPLQKGAFAVYDGGRCDYDVSESTGDDCQIVYWVLNSMKKDFVAKDPTWLASHLPQLEQFWGDVLRHRAEGTLPEETKKQQKVYPLSFDL